MKGITVLAIGTAVLATACNAIVGVDDVKPKGASFPQKSKSGETPGDGADTDDKTDPSATPAKTDDGDDGDGDPKITASPECNGTLNCKRLAFVTREAFTGNLGGLAGADQKCFEAAQKITGFKGRAFRAWLSDTTASANLRLPKGTTTYRRTDDGVVASSFTDLTDGTVKTPIELDQKGTKLGTGDLERSVWTGTTVDGVDSTFNCFDWTSGDIMQSGTWGDSQATDSTWTDSATSSCNASRHLYCVEY